MKKFFTLIAAVLMAVGANAALENVANFTVAEGNPVDGSEIEGTNCTVQLHAAELKANFADASILGASLNTETKYVQIDFAEALKAGDIVYFSYFMGSNPGADNTEGISVSNVKVDAEGYQELAKFYVQVADKKNVVTSGYIAQGGEKKFIVYRLNSTTMFQAVKVVRGYGSTIDFTNPAINTKEIAEANIMDAASLTIEDTADGSDQSAVAEWKNVAGETASFSFTAAPISMSYKNSSVKVFAKTRTTGFQFNGTGQIMKITCNKGAKVTIVTGSYSKDGGATVTGAEETVVSFPQNTVTTAVLNSTSNCITLTMTGAYLIEKIKIENPSSGGIKGDVNGDGIVNGTDIQGVINFIVAGEFDAKADVNEDGKVNGTDIQEIINIIVSQE